MKFDSSLWEALNPPAPLHIYRSINLPYHTPLHDHCQLNIFEKFTLMRWHKENLGLEKLFPFG